MCQNDDGVGKKDECEISAKWSCNVGNTLRALPGGSASCVACSL
jgi:hypothetical protein